MLINMDGKNVIITGETGFISSDLIKKVGEKNHVIVIDNLSIGDIKTIQNLINSEKKNLKRNYNIEILYVLLN